MQKNGTVIIIEDFMQSELSLRGTALLVYAIIWSFCKLKGSFFAAVEYLAKRCRASERTVQYALRRLEGLGYIECRGKHEIFSTNIYECTRKPLPQENTQTECGTQTESEVCGAPCDSAKAVKGVSPAANRDIGATLGGSDLAKELRALAARAESKDSCTPVAKSYTPVAGGADPATISPWRRMDVFPFGTKISKRRVEVYDRDISAYYENYFDNYGIDDLVRLTPEQYDFLESWVGENTLECYILRLECCLREIPSFRSFSHYKTIKAWIAEDMDA